MTSDEIIRDIYAAALEEKPWQDVVDKTVKLVDATGAFMFTTWLPESQGGLAVFNGLPADRVSQFLAEVASVDVWYHASLRKHGVLRIGQVSITDELVPEKDLLRTRFYADYLRHIDVGRCLNAIVGDDSTACSPMMPFSLYRPFGSKPFSASDRSVMADLQPHLTRAMRIRHQLASARGHHALALDRVSTGVVVLGLDRRLLLVNPAADEIFRKCDRPLVKEGRLCTDDAAQCVKLEQLLKACHSYRFDGGFSLSIRLAGQPGSGIVARLAPPPATTPHADAAAAVAFIVQEGRSELDLQAMMTSLYKLTPAEAELAKALAEGMSPEDFAERRQVSLATVRTQLRSVFAKTGTHRQSDLMRLIYSIAR